MPEMLDGRATVVVALRATLSRPPRAVLHGLGEALVAPISIGYHEAAEFN
jgi:hypothetical protein